MSHNFEFFINIFVFFSIFWGIGILFEWLFERLSDKILGKEGNID